MFKNLLSKVGFGELPSSFGFVLGEKVELPFQSVWNQHKGQKRADGSAVSLFVFLKKDADSVQVAAAKNAQQLSKSLRHPNIITVLDSCETDAGIYVATEVVTALLSPDAPEETDGQPAVWGLYQALDALSFLHTSGFVHGLFGPAAIFVTIGGDYRVSGFELCKKGADAGDLLAGFRRCGPKMQGWPEPPSSLSDPGAPSSAIDFWGTCVLAAYVFGAARANRGRGVECRIDLARASQDYPPELQRPLADLMKMGALKGRSPIADLIALKYFQQHPAVHMMAFLSSLHIKSPEEKEAFFEALPATLENVPQTMQTRQVLPELLQAQKFPGHEQAQILPAILKIGTRLKDEEFKEKVAPLVATLFSSPDRGIRFRLLMSIGDMMPNLDDATINDKIFPECVNGFTDSSGPIREATVKALIFFVPRLKAKTVEGRVVKLLLKLMSDPEASIRTNAIICCGRISGHLPQAIASQMLSQGLCAGLKDPFGPCRSASLHTLLATCALFSAEDLANRLLPQVCLRLVDPDPAVSDNSFEVLTALQKHLRTQVDERRAAQQAEAAAAGTDIGQAAADSSAGGGQGTWGSWAMSTVGSRMSAVAGAMGSMKGDKPAEAGTSFSSNAPAPTTPTAATSFSSSAPPAPAAPSKPAAPSGGPARTTSGMSLSSAAKGPSTSSNSFDVGDSGDFGGGGGWGADDDFFDDFADDAPVAAVAAAPAKPAPAPAKPAAAKVRAAPTASAAAAAPAPAPAAKAAAPAAKASVKAAAAPKATAGFGNDDDDFWKEFDM